MAREIKKPVRMKEGDLKEYAGDVVIDVTPKDKAAPKAEAKAEGLTIDLSKAAQPNAVTDNLMSFEVWFQKLLAKNSKVKLSYKESLEAHCKSIGVGIRSTEEAFNAALAHFGL